MAVAESVKQKGRQSSRINQWVIGVSGKERRERALVDGAIWRNFGDGLEWSRYS